MGRNARKRREKRKLHKKIEQLNERTAEVVKIHKHLAGGRDNLAAELEELEQLRSQVPALTAQVDEYRGMLDEAEAELQEGDAERERLTEEVEQLTKALAEKEAWAAQLADSWNHIYALANRQRRKIEALEPEAEAWMIVRRLAAAADGSIEVCEDGGILFSTGQAEVTLTLEKACEIFGINIDIINERLGAQEQAP